MTLVQCACCPKKGKPGNGIMYVKVVENGKRISVPLCTRCEVMLETKDKTK